MYSTHAPLPGTNTSTTLCPPLPVSAECGSDVAVIVVLVLLALLLIGMCVYFYFKRKAENKKIIAENDQLKEQARQAVSTAVHFE